MAHAPRRQRSNIPRPRILYATAAQRAYNADSSYSSVPIQDLLKYSKRPGAARANNVPKSWALVSSGQTWSGTSNAEIVINGNLNPGGDVNIGASSEKIRNAVRDAFVEFGCHIPPQVLFSQPFVIVDYYGERFPVHTEFVLSTSAFNIMVAVRLQSCRYPEDEARPLNYLYYEARDHRQLLDQLKLVHHGTTSDEGVDGDGKFPFIQGRTYSMNLMYLDMEMLSYDWSCCLRCSHAIVKPITLVSEDEAMVHW